MEKLIDMHMHTTYSDGELSPDELINLAIEKNIQTMAITDHDTIEGIKRVDKSKYPDIEIINGIELSAKFDIGQMHILGYDIDLESEILNNKMTELKNNSIDSLLSTMEQIKRDYGIRFSYEDIKKMINSSHNLNRVDLAKLCVKYGYADNVQDAFDKYLRRARKEVKKYIKGLEYQDCIELILNSGGIPVLAHPKSLKLNKEDFLILLEDMINCGLQGIEVYHSSHSKEEMDLYLKIAEEYNLLISGGSDYHGPIAKPDIEIGTGENNNLKIKKLSLLDKIHQI